jgi:hypothetical protein
MAVEVFKTNVTHTDQARMLIDQIHRNFSDYRANFDLEDCDRILRVASHEGMVQASALVTLLKNFGFDAEVLSDDIPELLGF